jgi:hypothetical protein
VCENCANQTIKRLHCLLFLSFILKICSLTTEGKYNILMQIYYVIDEPGNRKKASDVTEKGCLGFRPSFYIKKPIEKSWYMQIKYCKKRQKKQQRFGKKHFKYLRVNIYYHFWQCGVGGGGRRGDFTC